MKLKTTISCRVWAAMVLLTGHAPFAGAKDDLPPLPVEGPLSLHTCLELALAYSPQLDQGRARLQEIDALVALTETARRPAVGGAGSYGVQSDSSLEQFGPGTSPSSEAWNAGVEARISLYSGGRFTRELAAVQADHQAAVASFLLTAEQIMRDVRIRYYEAVLGRRLIALREQNIGVLEENFRQVKSRVDAGTATTLDLMQAQVALANEEPELVRARHRADSALEALWLAGGMPYPRQWNPQAFQLPDRWQVPAFDDRVELSIQKALEGRVELAELEAMVEAREQRVDKAGLDHRPRVEGLAGYSVRNSQFGSDESDSILRGWRVGMEATWNLYDSGATRARKEQLAAGLLSLDAARRSLALQIEFEVREEFRNCQQAVEVYAATEKALLANQEALRLAQARYAAGGATQLDVLQARLALSQAELTKEQAARDFAVATARYQFSMGPGIR